MWEKIKEFTRKSWEFVLLVLGMFVVLGVALFKKHTPSKVNINKTIKDRIDLEEETNNKLNDLKEEKDRQVKEFESLPSPDKEEKVIQMGKKNGWTYVRPKNRQ